MSFSNDPEYIREVSGVQLPTLIAVKEKSKTFIPEKGWHRFARSKLGSLLQGAFIIFLITLSSETSAQPTVPHYLNFQSVVTDDGGNLIKDPFVDLEFKILDSADALRMVMFVGGFSGCKPNNN